MNISKTLIAIKTISNQLVLQSEEELQQKIHQVKKRLALGQATVEDVLVDWFALVQEVSSRTIGLKHFDTQLMAGLILHEGKIVEMKTGEGKTLASTLPVALNALSKKGVHVVTVNDYLAERDQKWMGKVYRGLGLEVGLIQSSSSAQEKRQNYGKDITYVTNSELVFDYLRDSSASQVEEIVQRPFHFCILDEIDSILIDEARTPLILSTIQGDINKNKLCLAKCIADILEKEVHFQVDEKRRDINLTEKGYQEVQIGLGKKTLYDVNDPWILEILNALKAKYIFKLNKDYIVLNQKICIVDEFSGRIMEDRRWSTGIHEAIETKENLELGGETKTKSSITYQNFFTLYPKLAGMTGTAKTAEQEFQDIYNLEVVVLPTSRPMIRQDAPDLVYQTEMSKWKAVLAKAKECFTTGQPLLIGTATVEKSEFLSDLFQFANIPHQVLNAKPENVARESEIVGQAGERYAVTIATNMAGRGTDIILGGNPIFQVKQLLWDLFFPETLGPLASASSEISDSPLMETRKREKKEKEKDLIETKSCQTLIQTLLETYHEKKEKLSEEIQNLPYSLENSETCFQALYKYFYQAQYQEWEKENQDVKNLGGLLVLGTERHETRRIDNQLRGRAGRQGDPGISQFFVSLEDELIQLFGGDNIRKWVEFLIQDKDIPLESDLLTRSLEDAQKKSGTLQL